MWLAAAAVSAQETFWIETFPEGRLDPARWQVTSAGDFRERDIQVVEVPSGSGQFRLALSADTQGTSDETVKVLGVRSVARVPLALDSRISFDLDWNNQENGSYLTAAAVLSPQVTSGDPLALSDWFKVEYVGVPPGRQARMVIAARRSGRERTLFTDGWPDRNRAGRPIGRQRVAMVVRNGRVDVSENGEMVYTSPEPVVGFTAAYVYLQMSSHSNYPRRTIHFGHVEAAEYDHP